MSNKVKAYKQKCTDCGKVFYCTGNNCATADEGTCICKECWEEKRGKRDTCTYVDPPTRVEETKPKISVKELKKLKKELGV